MEVQLHEDVFDDSIWQAFDTIYKEPAANAVCDSEFHYNPKQQLHAANASPCSTASMFLPQLHDSTAHQQQQQQQQQQLAAAPAGLCPEDAWLTLDSRYGSCRGSSTSLPSSCNSASEPALFAPHVTWHQATAAGMHQHHGCANSQQQDALEIAVAAAAAAVAGSSSLPLLPQAWTHSSCADPVQAAAAPAAAASSAVFGVQGPCPIDAAEAHFTRASPAAAAAAAAGTAQSVPRPSQGLSLSSDCSALPLQDGTPTAAAGTQHTNAQPPPPTAAGCKRPASAARQGSGSGSVSKRARQQRISKVRHEEEVTQLKAQVARLSAANAELQAQVSSLSSSKLELLDSMAGLTGKWRTTVAGSQELHRQNIAAREEVAALQQQLQQLHGQQQHG